MTETEKKMAAEILRLEDERVTGPNSLRVARLPKADKGGDWQICGICDGIEPEVFAAIKAKLDLGDCEGAWEDCLQYVLENTHAVRAWLGSAEWPGVEFFCRDFLFNAGSRNAGRCLQRALNALGFSLVEDGIVGRKSREALHVCLETKGEEALLAKLEVSRRTYYRRCKQFATFGRGWLARVDKAATFAGRLA